MHFSARSLRRSSPALTYGMNNDKQGKDLTKEAPRSPRVRIGGYAILARTYDKCRALLWGDIGEYHFDCPLDNMLFGFKGVKGDDFKAEVEKGATDEEMARFAVNRYRFPGFEIRARLFRPGFVFASGPL